MTFQRHRTISCVNDANRLDMYATIVSLKCDPLMSATHANGRNNSYANIGTLLRFGYVDNNKVLKNNRNVLKR